MSAIDHGKTLKDFVILAGSVVRLPNSPNVPMKTHKVLLTFIAFLSGLTFIVSSRADDFEPASVILDNHAALVPVLDGIRRVRVSYLDVQNQWQAYSMAHLAGDEGQIKLRLPDKLSLADVLVEVSYTDPFPYEVYAGRSDFVVEAAGTITSGSDIRTGADFAADGNGDATPAIGYFPDRGVMISPYQSYSRDWSSHETKLQILTFDDDSLEKAGVIDTNNPWQGRLAEYSQSDPFGPMNWNYSQHNLWIPCKESYLIATA